jgi:ferredoxin
MAKLIFEDNSEEVEIPDNTSIEKACEEHGIPIACAEGICGACTVEVTEGKENLTEMTEAEKDFLGESSDERMACQCKIIKGTVKIKP